MPVPVEDHDRDGQPAGPGSVWSASQMWDLEAAPASIEVGVNEMRALGARASSALATMDSAARLVDGEGSWEGDTAQAYQGHRRRLAADLGRLAELATSAAGALDVVASTLRSGQAMLDGLRAQVSTVPVTTSATGARFHPRDEAEAARVRDALAASREIRAWVDEQLALNEATFAGTREDIAAIIETWRPRTLRVLDLNIGQGHGNAIHDSRGTDPGEIDEIGQIIADQDANVVTLQEVFESDLGTLQMWLEENTGDDWDVHFSAAMHKYQFDDSVIPDGEFDAFGNAVLVRRGDGVDSSTEVGETVLQDPGALGAFGGGAEGRSMEHVQIRLDD